MCLGWHRVVWNVQLCVDSVFVDGSNWAVGVVFGWCRVLGYVAGEWQCCRVCLVRIVGGCVSADLGGGRWFVPVGRVVL